VSIFEAAKARAERTEQFGAKLLGDSSVDWSAWEMQPADRAKVKPARDYVDQVIDYFESPNETQGAYLPWGKTHEHIRLRSHELSIWAGVNGHGKSMLLSEVMLCLAKQGERICIASLEMKPIATLARMARQALATSDPSPSEIRNFAAMMNGHLWLYDQQGTVKFDRMLAVLRYCREELKVGHFVIDSLMKCGIDSDDYNAQKRFVDCLSTYAKDSGVHVHLVAHSRKRENEKTIMDKFDVKGASELTDMADNVFTVWRNKPKEQAIEADEHAAIELASKPDAILICDKQRNGDWEGRIGLWFNKPSLQYLAKPSVPPIDFMKWELGGWE